MDASTQLSSYGIIESARSNATGVTDTAPSNGLAISAIAASATDTTNVNASTWQ
jgi:hypothetical protein